MASRSLHITIGAVPEHQPGNPRLLAHELSLVKAAVLYADNVTLCSGAVSIARSIDSFGKLDLPPGEWINAIFGLRDVFGDDPEFIAALAGLEPFVEDFLTFSDRKPIFRTRRQREFISKFRNAFAKVIPSFRKSVSEKAALFGLDELELAEQDGVLVFHEFNLGIKDLNTLEKVFPEYLDVIQRALSSPSTHPLFDISTANLVRTGIEAGVFQTGPPTERKGKQTRLVADLFERLPVLTIPMDELLDVRRELEKPLIHFRAEIITLSEDIECSAWDKDFPQDVEQLVRQKIQPSLSEIEDKLKALESSEFWTRRIIDKWGAAAGLGAGAFGLGAAIAPSAGIIAALGGAAVFIAAGSAERRDQLRDVQRNGLYFYHRVGQVAQEHDT